MEKKIEVLFEIHEKNEEWFNAHFTELEQKYGSKFFAIRDQSLLTAEDEFEKLLDFLEKKISTLIEFSLPPSRRKV